MRPGASSLAVVTIVAGRHEHLRVQREHLRAAHPGLRHVVVSMGDPGVGEVVGADPCARVIQIPVAPEGLPLARARNVGATAALAEGADLLVFLDVDCVPDPGLPAAYLSAAARGGLLAGPVTYLEEGAVLPPPGASLLGLSSPHPARPAPPPGRVTVATDLDLFWSLSFAIGAEDWRRVGGFCEDYVGYGGEDTDFARCAGRAGLTLRWVGGAEAFHQHHPPSAASPDRVEDIVRNATLFRSRWGSWPMRGWLERLSRDGQVRWDPDSDELVRNA
ncbi:MAG: glycosyltransferase family 2 protein [Micrococcales bacterium]|nr:glycosyltransferase family 2 protein [Micrococcales bacterium]